MFCSAKKLLFSNTAVPDQRLGLSWRSVKNFRPLLSFIFENKSAARRHARRVWSEFLGQAGAGPALLDGLRAVFPRQSGGRLLASVPLADELDHRSVLFDFPGDLYLPVMVAPGAMDFRLYARGGQVLVPLEPGPYGLAQPVAGEPLRLPLHEADFVLIPALAASGDGTRLGRGGGFYDRWRERLAGARRVSALPRALCDLVFPVEAHDLRLNRIVTEAGLVDY